VQGGALAQADPLAVHHTDGQREWAYAVPEGGMPADGNGTDLVVVVHAAASYVGLALDTAAVLLVAAGAVVAAGRTLCMAVGRPGKVITGRAILVGFGLWLVAALTFQLGSDIVDTTVTPTWDELGRLAAVAGIRTFLTYFLDRDLERARKELHGEASAAQAAAPHKTKELSH
jgi:uncharacterized membrane protein